MAVATSRPLKVLHLAAGNRWTGAAAPAFAEVEALRAAGVDAHYAYVGGYKLQAKLGHHDFAHPIIEKAQNPLSFLRTRRRARPPRRPARLRRHPRAPHVRSLAGALRRPRATGVRMRAHVSRAARAPQRSVLALAARGDATPCSSSTKRSRCAVLRADAIFTPPPLDHRAVLIRTDRTSVDATASTPTRARHGRSASSRRTAASRRRCGRSPSLRRADAVPADDHRPRRASPRARSARQRRSTSRTTSSGPAITRTTSPSTTAPSDLLLFTARGSDEGHRAVLEAMACGVPVATLPDRRSRRAGAARRGSRCRADPRGARGHRRIAAARDRGARAAKRASARRSSATTVPRRLRLLAA